MKKIIVTGGAGFIGSNFIKKIIDKEYKILNIDNLTYASNYMYIKKFENKKNYKFIKLNINNYDKVNKIIFDYNPDIILNFAAESHVDNSIIDSRNFINTNIFGVYNLLRSTDNLLKNKINKKNFKFVQISTDEVFGSLDKLTKPKIEESLLNPSSPYSASKSSADLLVNAWQKTYNIPSIITHCTNNYGPNQNNEKFIPKIISNAFKNKKIPIYGSGNQKRDWIFVDDHCEALIKIINSSKINKKYNISASNNITNKELVKIICNKIDNLFLTMNIKRNKTFKLVKYVPDRIGHDFRYALNSKKITDELNWRSKMNISDGLDITIKWYFDSYFK